MRAFLRAVVSVSVGFMVAAGAAQGAVNYSSQARSVYAEAGFGGGVVESFSASDFATFNQTATAGSPPLMNGGATTSQNSSLGQSAISNVSSVQAFDSTQNSLGRSRSLFTTSFSVDAPTPWQLSGSWMFSSQNVPTSGVTGTLLVRLEQQGGGFLYNLDHNSQLSNPVVTSGVLAGAGLLQPGQTYILTMNMTEFSQVIAGTTGGNGSLDATLSFVPAPSAAALLGLGGLVAGRRRRA